MTPELLRDIRTCAERLRFQGGFFVSEFWQPFRNDQAEQAAERVLAWLDGFDALTTSAQQQPDTPGIAVSREEALRISRDILLTADAERLMHVADAHVEAEDVDLDDWEYAYTAQTGRY